MLVRRVAKYTQKRICVHIWTKNIGRFYHNSDGFLMVCVQNVCAEPILISLNPILTESVMMFASPYHRHPVKKGLIIFFYNLPLPRVCISWQTVQTLMRRRVLRRLIWVYAVYLFLFRMHSACSTLKFRLATPMPVLGLVDCVSLTQTISDL